MLRQRIVTAIILAAVFLSVLFLLPVALFPAFVATIVLISAWEWANLSGIESRLWRTVYVAVQAVAIAALAHYLGAWPGEALDAGQTLERYRQVMVAGCLWWALALLWVQGYPSSGLLWGRRTVRSLMGFAVLVPTWAAFSYVRAHEHGAWLVLMIVALVAAADIGGYFVGRRFGRHKLAPQVSPGKTWEGFAGGVCANGLLSLSIWLLTDQPLLAVLVLVIPASLVSVLGDLLESMIKRQRGIKDSSALLPGHGGVLDRVDSLTAAAPVFALALIAVDSGIG